MVLQRILRFSNNLICGCTRRRPKVVNKKTTNNGAAGLKTTNFKGLIATNLGFIIMQGFTGLVTTNFEKRYRTTTISSYAAYPQLR